MTVADSIKKETADECQGIGGSRDAAAAPRARAQARYVRMTPMKARRVVDLIRGRSAADALAILKFAPQAAAEPVAKVVASAVANAENNEGIDPTTLVIDDRLRGRGPDAQAVPAAGPGPRVPDPQAHLPHHHRGRLGQAAAAASEPGRRARGATTAAPTATRRGGPASGSEDQPARVPARYHHRLELPLVCRQGVRRVRRRGRRHPQADGQGHGAGRHLEGGDRAHP